MRRLVAAAALTALAGCVTPTSFSGAPKVQNGVQGCQAACEGWGMDLAGMVKMGEYSDGCICKVKERLAPAGSPSAGALPAAAGVYVQMLAAAAAAQRLHEPDRHPYVPHSPVGSPGWRPGLP